MAVYYIDPEHGKKENSGLGENEPLQTNRKLSLQPGDTVLFKRGSVIRDALWNVEGCEGQPITYGAYGTGANPVFCGSVDLSDCALWTEVEAHIWKCTEELETAACNFVFDNDRFGALVWKKEELRENGDWWDSGFSNDGEKIRQHETLLYCEKNPAEYYAHIECVLYRYRSLAATGHDMVIQDLTFCNNGVHAIAGEGPVRNMKIVNCRFFHIGGCVWSLKQKIRFGNGVECWNVAENVLVEGCRFDDIYDSAVTHQGGAGCEPAKGFYIRNNVFSRCGMAAYEQRDRLPKDGEFVGNLCMDAGKGFSHFRAELPRNSEIWPQPMGHHIFLWRIEAADADTHFLIGNNTFQDAPYGAAIYSIINAAAEEKIMLAHNVYEMQEFEMLAYLQGRVLMKLE